MRICFIAGANSIHSKRWIDHFADRGYEVEWISLTSATLPAHPAVRFHQIVGQWSLRPGPISTLRAILKVRSVVRKSKPDLVHAHYAGLNGVVGAFCGVRPFVLTAWGSDVLFTAQARVRGLIVRLGLRRADVVTCDAEHMRRAISALDVPADRIAVIYFGTDTDRFTPDARDEDLRRRWQARGPVVVSLRRFEPVYDVGSLVEAVPHVLQRVPTATFVLAGDGSMQDALRARARELRVEGHIVFTGALEPADLPTVLASADVYVSTSLSDGGLAASTAEAMACERPVIVTDSGENDLWVEDGITGRLVPCSDPIALADAISATLENPGTASAMGRRARGVIVDRNNTATEMARVGDLYERLMGAVSRR